MYDGMAGGLRPPDFPPQFDPDLITFTPRWLSWDSFCAVGGGHAATTALHSPEIIISESVMAHHHPTLLFWSGSLCGEIRRCSSVSDHYAVTGGVGRGRRGDPGPSVSAHPAAVTISAWRCLMPARPCQAELGQALDVETSPAQSPTLISLPSLLFGRKMSRNQIPRQDF